MNKHLYAAQEKYSIAWFRIAEYIRKGEREKALGVYRLLAHSIADSALIIQVEGDIYLSFDDKKNAVEKYQTAAQEYIRSARYRHAISLYEHMIHCMPEEKSLYESLYQLSVQFGEREILPYAGNLFAQYFNRHHRHYEGILTLFTIHTTHPPLLYPPLTALCLSWFQDAPNEEEKQKNILVRIAQYSVEHGSMEEFCHLLSTIKIINEPLFTFGCTLLENITTENL